METVRKARLRWFRHVQRRDGKYIGRKMLKMKIPGKRKRGNLKRRCKDEVREVKQIVGVREQDVEDTARWRRMIHCGNS